MIKLDPKVQEYQALASEIGKARKAVIEALSQLLKLESKQRLVDIEIAVGEVLQNIVRYEFGGGDPSGFFRIKWEVDQGEVVRLQIFDSAPPIKDLSFLTKTHEISDKGGMGLSLISRTSKKYEINIEKGINIHTLIF
jgi:anti-sigma regulatory factor (Ser/Thr protein kinase)